MADLALEARGRAPGLPGLGLAVGVRLLLGILASSPVYAQDIKLENLDGTPVALTPPAGPRVLMFWRADCAPCLVELRTAQAYADAAGPPGRLLFVGLQAPAALRKAAVRAGVPATVVVHGIGRPEAILTAFGGAPARLPLAVALDSSGQICARHSGLLGTDLVRDWRENCGVDHARG